MTSYNSTIISRLKAFTFDIQTVKALATYFTFGLILTLGFYLRITGLEKYYFWGDDAMNLINANNLSWNLVEFAKFEPHPPLYYFLLKIYMKLFGVESHLGLRSISLLSGLLTIFLGYFAAINISKNRAVGLLGAFLIATSPPMIEKSQELRCYSLELMFLFALVGLVSAEINVNPKLKWLLMLAALACLSFYGAIFFVVPVFMVLFLQLNLSPSKTTKKQTIGCGFTLIGLIFIIHFLSSQYIVSARNSHAGYAFTDLSLKTTWIEINKMWAGFFFFYLPQPLTWVCSVAQLIGLGLLLKHRNWSLLILSVVPFALGIASAQVGLAPFVFERWCYYLIPSVWIPLIYLFSKLGSKNNFGLFLIFLVMIVLQRKAGIDVYKIDKHRIQSYWAPQQREMQVIADSLAHVNWKNQIIILPWRDKWSVEMEEQLHPSWAVFNSLRDRLDNCGSMIWVFTQDGACTCVKQLTKKNPDHPVFYLLDNGNHYQNSKFTGVQKCLEIKATALSDKSTLLEAKLR